MANRAYLYSANEDLTKLRDLSEWKSDIPLFHKIVLGVETELCNSKIWEDEEGAPTAIKGNFKKGLKKFYDFIDYLETQTTINKEAISESKQETKNFFEEHPDRIQDLFFLEGGEIYDLTADIDAIEKQNGQLYREIISISKDIDDILNEKPENVFDFKNSWWLQQLEKDSKELSTYWTRVTYFSFNKT